MIKKYKPKPLNNIDIGKYDTENTQSDNTNTMGDVFQAIKRAILTVREDEENPDSPHFFKTIAVDTGQFERIMSKTNTEYETAFPACFVRFTNVHFLVAQQRIGEGRATLRIRFILNRLDNQHVDWETYPFHIAERLNQAIQAAKDTEESLQERCNLQYFDMPQSTNMLQAYWLDYEIYFKITSSYKYLNWVKKKVITPPFTNNSDVPNNKEDVNTPTYNDSSKINDGIIPVSEIQVYPENCRIQVGEQLVLKVTLLPKESTDKAITFSSSEPNIVTVNQNGIITGVSNGVCDIIITSSNNISVKKNIIVFTKI